MDGIQLKSIEIDSLTQEVPTILIFKDIYMSCIQYMAAETY